MQFLDDGPIPLVDPQRLDARRRRGPVPALPRPRAARPRARPARRARAPASSAASRAPPCRRLRRFARLARLGRRLRLRLALLGLLRRSGRRRGLQHPPDDAFTASPTEAAMAATAPPALSTNPFIVDWTPSTTSSGGPSSSVNMAAMSPRSRGRRRGPGRP